MSHRMPVLKSLVLAVSILVRYDAMEILVWVDPGTETYTAAEIVAHACGVARTLDLPLPTPYHVQWGKALASGAIVPDASRVADGTLTAATCART